MWTSRFAARTGQLLLRGVLPAATLRVRRELLTGKMNLMLPGP